MWMQVDRSSGDYIALDGQNFDVMSQEKVLKHRLKWSKTSKM